MGQTLTVAPVEATAGEDTELSVSISGQSATALQFNLRLPEGVTLSESEVTKGAAAVGHTLNVVPLDNGDRLFILYDMNLNYLKEGELMRIPVKVDDKAQTGNGKLYSVRTATAEAKSYSSADVSFAVTVKGGTSDAPRGDLNGDGEVNMSDVMFLVQKILNGKFPDEDQPTGSTYYWYVGTTQPTDPTNSTQNTGLNKWTSLGSTLPTESIRVAKEDPEYNDHTWYIAAPSDANFVLYNATNVASAEATWNKSTFNVGSIQYTLWTSKAQSDQAGAYLHK
jgi:hypothetical protein